MKEIPFWRDDFPRPADLPVRSELPDRTDVAVVGGGYTGLSAARTLARNKTEVVVLEQEEIGWGASSRNGGITGCHLKQGVPEIIARYGEKYGRVFWEESLRALELVRILSAEEGIDCDWQQNGGFNLAFKPGHVENMKQRVAWENDHLDHGLRFVPQPEMKSYIGSDVYYGGVVDPHGATLHPAKLVYGLAGVAARYGADLYEGTTVEEIEMLDNEFLIRTSQGSLHAKEVLVATNGYTTTLVPEIKPKVIPVGSYSIVTEPLPPDLQEELSPKGMTFWDTKWFLNYFRVTPDGRMLWGGRNDLSTDLDLLESAHVLRRQLFRAFPQLQEVEITHTWSGKLGIPFDLVPHLGRVHGIHYALGYGGHGLHTALYLGQEAGRLLTGEKKSSPFQEIPAPTYFFYRDRAWFLPLVAAYYRVKDWLS